MRAAGCARVRPTAHRARAREHEHAGARRRHRRTERYGQLGPECADLYYYYGRALTLHVSANQGLFAAESEKPAGEDGNDDEDEDDGEDDDDGGGAPAEAAPAADPEDPAEEAVDDKQIAYEALETARLILAGLQDTPSLERLADVRSALADLAIESGTAHSDRVARAFQGRREGYRRRPSPCARLTPPTSRDHG